MHLTTRNPPTPLHLATLNNNHVHIRDILPLVTRLGILHLLDRVHPVHDFTKDYVLIVQEGGGDCGNKELGTVGVWPCVLENKSTLPAMGALGLRKKKKKKED